MIKITLITLGKLKEKYLSSACEEYKKRLSRFCSLEIIELSPVNLPEKPSEEEVKAALQKEGEMILKRVPENSFVTALCVEGKHLSSEELSKTLSDKKNMGIPLCFIIGSSYGLGEVVKKSVDFCLSLSKMTFPHQLFRVMLLEQIYRAFKIEEGSTYHK